MASRMDGNIHAKRWNLWTLLVMEAPKETRGVWWRACIEWWRVLFKSPTAWWQDNQEHQPIDKVKARGAREEAEESESETYTGQGKGGRTHLWAWRALFWFRPWLGAIWNRRCNRREPETWTIAVARCCWQGSSREWLRFRFLCFTEIEEEEV